MSEWKRTVKRKCRGKGKYIRLTWEDRLRIETMYNIGRPVKEIAEVIGKTPSAIYYELHRGFYMHRNTDWTESKKYSAYKAHERMKFERTTKCPPLKIQNDYEFINYIEKKIVNEKMSPDAILGEIKKKNLVFKTSICTTTLYSYIDKGLFLHVTNKNLLVKGKRKNTKKKVRPVKKVSAGESIDNRPAQVENREEFGHWEMDTVIGTKRKGKVLFVFTERKTRQEIILIGKDKTAITCVSILNKLERRFGKNFSQIFKTITCDNGVEFSAYELMEASFRRKGNRTKIYYCHPYSSWERGSNENQNKFIRRFIPKGVSMANVTDKQMKEIQDYINGYPRRIFNYCSSSEFFEAEMKRLKIFL